jgi:hypothetical protein
MRLWICFAPARQLEVRGELCPAARRLGELLSDVSGLGNFRCVPSLVARRPARRPY